MSITIYHNPRCMKSRQTLQLLRDNGEEPEVVEYLKNPPSPKDLKTILMKLDLKPTDIIRKQDNIFKEKYKDMEFSDEEWLQVLYENPRLIERPIVVKGNSAVIGRPPENAEKLLN